ncbi:amino acid adenylation domain-containing protein [Streptomyces griseoluteus]|uniref:amino acid adenylation domain-containing protein n=1 Tax=Streptomyces griseoluteus TaxID=29306 RepID=UPI0038141D7B
MNTYVDSSCDDASPSRSVSALADAVLARARRAPSAVAVEDGTHLLDFGDLDRLSGRVAARLRDHGVRPGQAVAVCLPRSWRLVCVMLGIRRAGATVVPLDRLSPSDRQRHILDDSGAVAVVHDELLDVGKELFALDADLLLDDEEPDTVSDAHADRPGKAAGDTGTGFVFYTSGSTGSPKGVEVTDAGVLRLAEPGYISLRQGARYACLSNPAFDALSFEVWVPLLTGGVCVILDDEQVHSPHRLAGALRDRRVDTMFITVALFNTVVERVPDCFSTVSQVLVGGENPDARLIRRWYETNSASSTVLHNAYGPTETTTFALCHPIPRDFAGEHVPLGTPLSGTRTLLRAQDGRTAEPGEIAELLLAGPALARGYRNLPDQTDHSFVVLAEPEGETGSEERWYRTGDLVRQDTEGRMMYVGRADRQVKVRGFRIEPGEVERRVLAHPAVRQAYVCTRRDESGRHELLAFVVPVGEPGDLSFDAYDQHLTTGLPPYMRPHHTHLVPELPLTANGKVDREALLRDAPAPWRRPYDGEARVSAEQRPLLDLAEDILGVAGLRPADRWIPHGGDSLKALRLRFEVMRRFHVDLPQSLVLTADFAALAEAVHAQDAAIGEHPPVPAACDEPTARATREQERLWFLHQRDPEDRAYDVPLVFRLRGGVDRTALHQAVRTLVERHAALRTGLVPTAHGLRQRTGEAYDPWEPLDGGDTLDARELAGGTGERWRGLADRFFDHRFDLTDPRMLRAAWVDGPDTGVLLLHLHHVAVDGWSLNLLFRDLTDAYHTGLAGEPGGHGTASAFTPLDFARWQEEWQTSAAYVRRRARLGGRYGRDGEPSPVLPASEAAVVRPQARLLRTSLDLVRRAALDRLAAERGLTRFQLLVSAFAASVYGVTGQERPIVASPVSGRSRPEFADAVGMFANTVLLDLELRPRAPLTSLLASHADTVRDVLEDQEVALADLLSEPVLRERSPLFDYLFVLENTDFSALRLAGCEVRPEWPEPLGAKCALTLSVVEHESGFDCLWEYREDLGAERAEAAARLFRRYVDHLTGDDDVTLHELIADHRRGLPDNGRGEALVPDFPTIADGFARQVAATPHAAALTDGSTTFTYAELNSQAEALAADVRACHPLPADPTAAASVALYLQPSVEHIVALLAAARLGVTVVPLDPAYPPTLLRHVLEQADPLCVLVRQRDLGVLDTLAPPSLPRHVVTLTEAPEDAPATVPTPYANGGSRPLYTLFTSGSTGVPKGVQVPDGTLCNLLTWQRVAGGLDRPARTQQFSMLSFDVSFQEIFTTLCSGGLLHLIDPGWRHDAPALLDQLESAAVERIFLPYVALQLLAEHGVRTGRYPSHLREVVTAGEQLVCTDAIRRWFAGLPGARLFNHYGPTETHVVSSLCLEGDPAEWPLRPAIGRPVAGAVLRVVDDSGLPVAAGATGALLIGGPMAGRCYLGDQTAHRDRFTDDPELGVLYRTGDLARFDAQGLLHYAGREDAQVKLAGHRLELGQVEAALLQYPGVVNAVATVADGHLVAAVEFRGEDPDPATLHEHLSALLPAHVRIARFRRVSALPRTPSGKLDRRATLTAPGRDLRQAEPEAADLSPVEERLLTLFEDVTGRRPGVRQRYFDAGATSLDLMRFQLACAGEDGLSFSVADLFEHVTLRALAGFLAGRQGGQNTSARPAGPDGKAGEAPSVPRTGMAAPDRDSGTARARPGDDAARPAFDTGVTPPAPEAADEPVAVIGMAVRLPGAPDLASFWDLVTSGRRGIEHFPVADDRVGARSQMEGLLAFDPGRFHLSPGEARLMDPQQRHLLMSCVEALAHAGIDDPAPRGVGLIAACGENTYFQNMLRQGDPDALPDAFRLALHHEKDFLATKAAYHLGLTGPAFTVQSACSSSLVGVHLAAGLLRQGDAEIMLVGGVLVDTELTDGYTYRPQHIFSPDGHCRPFSADASGTVGASGTGVVVLKPLAAARRDGDTVYAVVTGSAVNNDGSDKLSYSAPARSGQRAAIRTALRRSGRRGTDLGYVEAHGTGTVMGDPVEAAALRDAYGLASNAGVALSSVKSQIGHLGAAAGVVGMVRAVLAVHHGVVPPTADFDRLNPEIDAGPFRVPVTAEPWPRHLPRVAAVSSFGIGGTNAHLLLEHPADRPARPAPGGTVPAAALVSAPAAVPCVLLSASSETALRADGRRIADYLDAHPSAYPQVLRHLQAGRPALGHRAAAVCRDAASASAWLRAPEPVTVADAVQAAHEEEMWGGDDPRHVAQAWTAGRRVVWPEGPACAPWDFPPPAFDLSEYDFSRDPGRAAPPYAFSPVAEESGPPSRRLPAGQWLHQPQWTRLRRARADVPWGSGTAVDASDGVVNAFRTPMDRPQEAPAARRIALVLTADFGSGGDGDLGTDTWRFLEDHYARVVRVRPAAALSRLADDRYEVSPVDAAQLAALLTLINDDGVRPDGKGAGVDWLHALPLALDGAVDEDALEHAQRVCLDAVAALGKALADLPDAARPRVWLLSHGSQPVTGTVAAPLAGLLAAGIETPRQELGVLPRWIDLPGPDPVEWGPYLPELLRDDTLVPRMVALRDGYWWHRPLLPVPASAFPSTSDRVAEPGTHLILGGTGGIGVTLATRLLADPANRVVLLARSTDMPARLEAHRGRVTLVGADLATENLDVIADRLAPHLDGLAGIVHAAGTAEGGLLAGRVAATARRTTAAKLRGALLVERLAVRHTPEYVAYCSSMAAHHGGIGQFDYAAANACLDALAHHAPQADGRTVRLSIGWDIWGEVGMAGRALAGDTRHQEHLKVALTPEDGAAVFAQALTLRLPHLMVSTTHLEQARYFYEAESTVHRIRSKQDTREVASEGTRSEDPAAGLTEVLCDLLGVDTVDLDASLYDLGADSLTLLELLEEGKRLHGTDIDLASLSHHVTLRDIIEKLGGGTHHGAERDTEAEVEVWQRGTGEDVLCLVHPVGGDIQAYRPLVSSLPGDLTVCLIPDPALRDPRLPARSITDRAADYLRAVRAAFPDAGPRLRLAGWSFGAWTALSMAALAEGEGQPAAALYLLDPPPPEAGGEFAAYDKAQVDEVFERELGGGRADGLTDPGRAYAERLARCCRANLAAMAEHRLPRITATPTTVWLADRPVDTPVLAPRPTPPGAWDAHLPATSRVRRVDADHYSLVTAPHARDIATVLADGPRSTRQP